MSNEIGRKIAERFIQAIEIDGNPYVHIGFSDDAAKCVDVPNGGEQAVGLKIDTLREELTKAIHIEMHQARMRAMPETMFYD